MDEEIKDKEISGENAESTPVADAAAVQAPAEKSGKKDKPKKSVGREILEWVITILVAFLIAMVIRSLIFEPVKVDGHSMDDTLADGEIMLVTKFNYSTAYLNIPFITGDKDGTFCDCPKVIIGGNPSRFDVIICRYPKRGDTNFVKRVVGLPGDTVEIKEGYLYVNGEKYDEPYINDEYRDSTVSISWNYQATHVPSAGDVLKLENGVVTLNGEAVSDDLLYVGVYDGNHRAMIQNGMLYIEDPEASTRYMKAAADGTEITFKEDNFFVMGDHRNSSNDSRSQGCITRSMVVGQVSNILWPLNSWRSIPNGLNVSAE